MAKVLVQYALKNGTQDNVSVLVLKFKWYKR
jgi:serine/threonine protein phosphatase PrpC